MKSWVAIIFVLALTLSAQVILGAKSTQRLPQLLSQRRALYNQPYLDQDPYHNTYNKYDQNLDQYDWQSLQKAADHRNQEEFQEHFQQTLRVDQQEDYPGIEHEQSLRAGGTFTMTEKCDVCEKFDGKDCKKIVNCPQMPRTRENILRLLAAQG